MVKSKNMCNIWHNNVFHPENKTIEIIAEMNTITEFVSEDEQCYVTWMYSQYTAGVQVGGMTL